MKHNSKKKYDNLKPDGAAYEELSSAYERSQMSDYSFKNRSQAIGKNAKRLQRRQVVRKILAVIGAILVLYFGYFIIAVIKGVNSRDQSGTTTQVETTTQESTAVPETEALEEQVLSTTEPETLIEDTSI